MDAVGLRVVGAALAQLEAARELVVHRRREPLDLLVREVGRERVRRELRRVEDLVRPRAADAGDRALVAEQRVQPARLAAQDLAELVGVEAERLRAEVRRAPRRACSGVRSQTPARFFFAFSVRTSFEPPANSSANAGVFGAVLAGAAATSAGRRSSGGRAGRARRRRSGRGAACRGARRRGSCRPSSAASGGSNVFSVAMCAGPGLRDRERRDRVVQLAPPRLHLRQLGHRRHGSERADRLQRAGRAERGRSRCRSRRRASCAGRSRDASTPPSRLPSGIMPQTIQRRDAFMRPRMRSGTSVW